MADSDLGTYKPPPLPPGAELYKPPPLPPGATLYKPPPLPPGSTAAGSSAALAPPGGNPSAVTAGLHGIEHGAGNIIYGGAQLGSRMSDVPLMSPEVPIVPFGTAEDREVVEKARQQRTADVDKATAEREQKYRADPAVQAHPYIAGAGNIGGEILTTLPFAYMPGSELTLPVRMGIAGLGGAAVGAGQPVTSGDYATEKLKQVGLGGLLGAVGLPIAERIPQVLSAGARWLKENLTLPETASIIEDYTRAVKVPQSKTQTGTMRQDYRDQVQTAVTSIIDNKTNLKFAEAGGVTSGELPKSLEQFGDAITQTKQQIFAQYDALARQAGEQGLTVELAPIERELATFAANPVKQDWNRSAVEYATSKIETLRNRGRYTPAQAQEAVADFNASLKTFYANPNYDTYSRAAVDAMIANQMRQELDRTITEATGPGYQALKEQYGALSEIEKDVNRRAGVVARQEKGGGLFGRLADISSAAELMHALTHFDPAAFSSAVGINVIKRMYQRVRDPDRAVEKIFERMDRVRNPPTPGQPRLGNIFVAPGIQASGNIAPYVSDQAYQALMTGQ